MRADRRRPPAHRPAPAAQARLARSPAQPRPPAARRPRRDRPPRACSSACARRRSARPRARARRPAPAPARASPAAKRRTPPAVSTSTPPACTSSDGRPAATTRPPARIATRSQHQLDLAQQMRVRAAPRRPARAAAPAARAPSAGRPDRKRSSARRAAAGVARRSTPVRARAAAACPSTSPRRAARARAAGRPAPAAPRAPPRRRPIRQAADAAGVPPPRAPAGVAEQLGEVAERATRLARSGRCAAHLARSAARAHEPAGDLHERRLARPVGSEQPDQLACADLQVDAVESGRAGRTLAQRRDGEGGCHAGAVWCGPAPGLRRRGAISLPRQRRANGSRQRVRRDQRADRRPGPRIPGAYGCAPGAGASSSGAEISHSRSIPSAVVNSVWSPTIASWIRRS